MGGGGVGNFVKSNNRGAVEGEQEVGDDLDVCVLNLQIV